MILMFISLGVLFFDKTLALCFILTTLLIMILVDLIMKKRPRTQG